MPPSVSIARRTAGAAFALAIAALLAWDLSAERFLGDELNALHYMRDSLLEYLTQFHYGHSIKLQFWAIHQWAGGELFWYRIPAVLCAAAALVVVAGWRPDPGDSGPGTGSRLVAGTLLAANASFLYFARWGMPVYAEAILASAWLLGTSLAWAHRNQLPAWRSWHVALMVVMPFLYPATIVLLGALSGAWQCLAWQRSGRAWPLPKGTLASWVPLLAGLVGLALTLWLTPDAHWERARGHHSNFSNFDGTALAFAFEALRGLGADLVAAAPGGEWGARIYAVLAAFAASAMVLAPALALRQRSDTSAQAYLRAMALLVLVAGASIAVSTLAGLRDAFPVGRVRYLFFLLPLLAFAALLSLGYLGRQLQRVAGLPLRALAAGAALLATFAIVAGVLQERSERRRVEHAQFDALTAPGTRVLLSVAPGYFFPDLLRSAESVHLRSSSPDLLPEGSSEVVRDAVGRGGQVGVYGLTSHLFDGEGIPGAALARWTAETGVRPAARLDVSPRTLLLFDLPDVAAERPLRQLAGEVALPDAAIVAVRLQPASGRGVRVRIDRLVLVEGDAGRTLDLCGDARLQLVRGQRLARVGETGCEFSLGTGEGSGWFVPSALRALPAGAGRRLRIEASGELDAEFQIFLDLGRGYGSRDMIRLTAEPAAPPR
jgi:hypothetical protein